MAVNATHAEYDASAGAWSRARDVICGEDAVTAAGERYLPRLESQSGEEYDAYRARAAFFNATARTADGFVGLIFRRAPFVRLPDPKASAGSALAQFSNDVDLLGTSLFGYGKNIATEVISVGRAGTLVDWESDGEDRVYVTMYAAESILNWRVERINGRNVPTRVVLAEAVEPKEAEDEGEDDAAPTEQIRVLKLVPGKDVGRDKRKPYFCQVEIWRRAEKKSKRDKQDWILAETRIPQRRGKPLPFLPFVFHGPRHSRPAVDQLPLADIIAVNLDHYRLDADYKHGIHFTALPTAWVSGFDKSATLRIGSSTAWVSEQQGAAAGFLEFTGQGLSTFERAMDRDERLMVVLGSRILAEQKKVGEAAEAIELRQSGENSILSNIATSLSESLTQVLRWAYWWNSTEETPDAVDEQQVLLELNTDFSTKGMTAAEMAAVVKSWQSGAMSQDTMLELFRKGEILPDGRTNEEEAQLIVGGTRGMAPLGPSEEGVT
jgi:hypothetical protein